MQKDKLIIFDTTMRDGEQSPGASMTKDEKLRIARQLERMRVDIIEAGFPAASDGDFEAVKAVAAAIKGSTVCGLARANERDVRRCGEAVRGAKSPRIHTFIATSPIHMEKKLRMEPTQVIDQAVRAIKWASEYTDNIEFSPEDAGRSDLDFLCRILEQVIRAGATTINVPDTVGYTLPEQFGALIRNLRERIPNSDKAVWSVHCHNDLGLAVANSLSAVMNGARQVECTINGLGERAGNAALEEIVMAVRTRQDMFTCDTNIDATQIVPASRLVAGITGFTVQPNKAIVGANAFAHEAGIHQDGVLKSRDTYEIMSAQSVGWHANKLVLGKHSGRNAFKARLTELGIELAVGRGAERGIQAFQGPRRQEARDFRRGPAGADQRGGERARRKRALSSGLADRAFGDRRTAVRQDRGVGWRRREARALRGQRTRSMPPSRRSKASSRAAPICCFIRSTTSPAAPIRRAKSRCGWRKMAASSTAWARTPTSWWPRPRPTSTRSTSCTRNSSA